VDQVPIRAEAQHFQKRDEIFGEEVEIFEESQEAEIGGYADEKIKPPVPLIRSMVDPEAAPIVDDSGREDQEEEAPVPPSEKEVGGGQEHPVLPSVVEMVVQGVDYTEKKKEFVGIELHCQLLQGAF
jgi:hypothetical protein